MSAIAIKKSAVWGVGQLSSVAASMAAGSEVLNSYKLISNPEVIQSRIAILTDEDRADIKEANRRLADPTETVMPFDEFCRKNGI